MQKATLARAGALARVAARALAELVVVSIAAALVTWAFVADQQWFDKHFLPAFFVSRRAYVIGESLGRIAAAATGVILALVVRPRIGRFISNRPVLVLNTAVAVVLAIGASELILSQLHLHAAEEEPIGHEPRRRLDARLGWTLVPSRVGHRTEAGRVIEYAIDPAGYRVRRVDAPVDPNRPTILFTGESMMVGEGLTWDESVPAQVEETLGIQSANLAVSAYASDQAYLRLQTELPRFRQPVAVVSLFTPTLFDRNMDDDRPHLGPGLVWLRPTERWRLLEILRLIIRYRADTTIERGIAVTREVLHATSELARSRGAVPIIVVPQFVPEQPAERALRQRILDARDLPVLRVELDGSWRIQGDGHPDARAARAIASAIATHLHESIP